MIVDTGESQNIVQSVFSGLDKLFKGRKNASYQFIVLEGMLRKIEQESSKNQILIKHIFESFAEIAYILRTKYELDLGGDKQNIIGKTSANGIIDSFVERYNLQGVWQLDLDHIETLSKIMLTNVKKSPIDAVTKEELGLFSKVSIDQEEYIHIEEPVKQVILTHIEKIREQNNDAITNYLKTISHNTIEGMVYINEPVRIEKIKGEKGMVKEEEVVESKPMKSYQEYELIQHIHNYMTQKGFTYPPQTIQNLYLSLKTKPFTILAGISGTGKSKIIELFAEAIGATVENGGYKLIAVRPDWSDSTELLGYRDLNNHFNPGILTCIIQQALKDRDNPYFVCLDEMNLARVEYYLSDFLSIVESRKWRGDWIVTHPLLQESMVGEDAESKEQYGQLYIPDNLYIVGTVNMDETTYPFSKKVLDRSNTIEFSSVNLMDGLEELEVEKLAPLEDVTNRYIRSDYLNLMDCKEYKEEAKRVIAELEVVNKILEKSHLHFAYRVRDEIVFYMLYNHRFELMSYEEAFDLQFLQKILPRITGSSQKVGQVLEELQAYATGRYSKTSIKIQFMIERYEEDGFTSYWM